MQEDKLKWIEIPQHLLIKDQRIQLIQLPEKTFCLVYTDQWYAFDSKCPHASAPLVTGWCEKQQVVCSYHRRKYDLQTGKGEPGQGDFLPIYPLKEERGLLFIGVKLSLWQRLF